MEKVHVRDVKVGSFCRLKDSKNSPLWIRGKFERSSKTFSLFSYEDSCHEIFRKGNSFVYVEDYDRDVYFKSLS